MWNSLRILPKTLAIGALFGFAVSLAVGGTLWLDHADQTQRLEEGVFKSARRFMENARGRHVQLTAKLLETDLAGLIEAGAPLESSTVVRALAMHPELAAYRITDAHGRTLAAHGDPDTLTETRAYRRELHDPAGRTVGELALWANLNGFTEQETELRKGIALRERADAMIHLRTFAVIATLVMLSSLLTAWAMGRNMRDTVVRVRRSTERLAGGDYEATLTLERQDEIGEMAQAVEYLRQRLKVTTISRNYLDLVLNSMPDAVVVTTPEGIIRRTNDATEKLLGWAEFELVGRELRAIIGEADRATFELTNLQEQRETVVETHGGQVIPVSITGSIINGEDTQFRGCVFVLRNITERKRAERRIRYLARYDTLTKIPNRMQFQHLLQQALARNLRQGRAVALLYIDLDRFKEVNDTFGHAAGDRTLEVLTERLQRLLPKDSVVGRLAGDEFAVFVEGLPVDDTRGALIPICRQLLDGIGGAFWLQGNEVYLSASLGISLAPRDAENVIDLVRTADAAMYHAKQNGGGSFTFYTPEMNNAAVERLMLKSKLRRSLERDEFVMFYQPRVDLKTGRVVGAEALLRWRLPGHGDISPAHFIPIAEENNLILAIGEWVMRRVCKEYAQWQQVVPDPGRVSINLSLKQLRQASFITRCQSVFREAGVLPSCFELEVTETTLMTDAKRTVKLLDELYALGIHLSIDDFGTGYSSLSTLQQLPVGTLKIDKSFIASAVGSPDNTALVRTMIEMGRNLNLEVVAEGVETPAQLALLRELGCDFAQGMLLGEPMSGEAMLALLTEQARGTAILAHHFG